MNRNLCDDDPLDTLLRMHAPVPLAEDGFVDRTLAAVERAAPRTSARRAATPREIALSLAAERRHGVALARLRHWSLAGGLVGGALLVLAMLVAPSGFNGEVLAAGLRSLFPLWLALMGGALWLALRELATD